MKKKILFTLASAFLICFISFWIIVSGGYDKQNKVILFLKKIVPPSIAREVRDKFFFIPKLQDRNKFLELQYRGRIDTGTMNKNTDIIDRELYMAMKLISETNKGPQEQNNSMGCSIKWKNE